MRHVKPHGMLYNRAAKDPHLAQAIAKAVHDYDPSLILVGLAGSELIRAGERHRPVTRQEVFADRGYQADGSWCRACNWRADSRRRAGAGANAGYGTSRESEKRYWRVDDCHGANGVHSWRRRVCACIRSQVTRRVQCA